MGHTAVASKGRVSTDSRTVCPSSALSTVHTYQQCGHIVAVLLQRCRPSFSFCLPLALVIRRALPFYHRAVPLGLASSRRPRPDEGPADWSVHREHLSSGVGRVRGASGRGGGVRLPSISLRCASDPIGRQDSM